MNTPLEKSTNERWETLKVAGKNLKQTAIEAANSEKIEIDKKINELIADLKLMRSTDPSETSLLDRFSKWISPDSSEIKYKKDEIANLKLLNKKIISLNKNLSKTDEADLDAIRLLSIKINDAITTFSGRYKFAQESKHDLALFDPITEEDDLTLSDPSAEDDYDYQPNFQGTSSLPGNTVVLPGDTVMQTDFVYVYDLEEPNPLDIQDLQDLQHLDKPILHAGSLFVQNDQALAKFEEKKALPEPKVMEDDPLIKLHIKLETFNEKLLQMKNDISSNTAGRITAIMKNTLGDNSITSLSGKKIIKQIKKINMIANAISKKEINSDINKKSFTSLFKKTSQPLQKEFGKLEKELQTLKKLKMLKESQFQKELTKLNDNITTSEHFLPSICQARFKAEYDGQVRILNSFIKQPSNLKQAKQLAEATRSIKKINEEFDNICQYYAKSKSLLKDAKIDLGYFQTFLVTLSSNDRDLSSLVAKDFSDDPSLQGEDYSLKSESFSFEKLKRNYKRWKVKNKFETIYNTLIKEQKHISRDLLKAKTETDFEKLQKRCIQFLTDVSKAKTARSDYVLKEDGLLIESTKESELLLKSKESNLSIAEAQLEQIESLTQEELVKEVKICNELLKAPIAQITEIQKLQKQCRVMPSVKENEYYSNDAVDRLELDNKLLDIRKQTIEKMILEAKSEEDFRKIKLSISSLLQISGIVHKQGVELKSALELAGKIIGKKKAELERNEKLYNAAQAGLDGYIKLLSSLLKGEGV